MKLGTPLLAMLALAPAAWAADAAKDYRTRPIGLIMPIGAGSANDTLGRIVANRMSQLLARQIVVDNRAGAGGIVGMEVGANAAPDGHTLIAGSAAAMSIVPHLHKEDPVRLGEELYDTMVKPVSSPEIRRELEQQVAEVQVGSGEAFRAFVARGDPGEREARRSRGAQTGVSCTLPGAAPGPGDCDSLCQLAT